MSESIEHEAVRGVLGGWVAGEVNIMDAWEPVMNAGCRIRGMVFVDMSYAQWYKFLADRETEGTEAWRARGDRKESQHGE